MNNLEEAEKCFNKAIDLNSAAGHPSDPTICFNLANVYLTQKNYDDALHYYDISCQLVPENPKYLYHKGIVYEAQILDIEEKCGP